MTDTNTNNDVQSLMYQRARSEWDERIGSAVSAAKNWRIACFFSLGITFIAVLGVIHIGSQSKIEPYVLNIAGDKVTMMPPLSGVPNSQLTQLYQKNIRDFVESSRTVYLDVAAQKKIIRDAYSYLLPNTPAHNQLTKAYKDNPPFTRAETQLVKVQVTDVLPLSDNTYQVEWNETISNRQGDTLPPKHFKATLNTVVVPPVNILAASANPLGFYIKTFNDVEVD